jgi:hypothetical protein
MRKVLVRLVHDGVQPGAALVEDLAFGVQDTKGSVHPGIARPDGAMQFDIPVDVTDTGDFRGPFVQGSKGARFLYLSWKRVVPAEHPWGWRIKMPLKDMPMPPDGRTVVADVRGRKPHTSAPVPWKIEA